MIFLLLMVSYIHVLALFWHPFPDAASIPSVAGSLVVDGVPGVAGFHAVRDMLALSTLLSLVLQLSLLYLLSLSVHQGTKLQQFYVSKIQYGYQKHSI
jgi:hypothetical protein